LLFIERAPPATSNTEGRPILNEGNEQMAPCPPAFTEELTIEFKKKNHNKTTKV
jgi:hypothetical protein